MNREVIIKNIFSHRYNGIATGLFLGGGLYHSINNEKSFLQVPLVIFFPVCYSGYHIFKNLSIHRDKFI
jgi:hypothetical protein